MTGSGVALIEEDLADPVSLFSLWFDEAKNYGQLNASACCLSTANLDGVVSARHVLLRRLDTDGFVIVTDRRSKKVKELQEHPQAAATFFWSYEKNGLKIHRQVRMEGLMHELPAEEYVAIYDREPLYCKLRSHVCHQGQPAVWENLNESYDKLFKEHEEGKNSLSMPDHYVGYKMVPNMMDFYYSHDQYFADRLCYLLQEHNWSHFRIAA